MVDPICAGNEAYDDVRFKNIFRNGDRHRDREGITSLDEKIVDIFPEYYPAVPSENLKKVCVRHLLSMSSGSDHEVPVDQHWTFNYFNDTEFLYEPGTEFLYKNAPATLLAALIRKKTGLSLIEYLKSCLFDIIGIDADNLQWFCAPNGDNFAPGGFHCTTEDALLLQNLKDRFPARYYPPVVICAIILREHAVLFISRRHMRRGYL